MRLFPAHFVLLFSTIFFTSSAPFAFATTAPFLVDVKLTPESEIRIQAWIAAGSRTRLAIRPKFSEEMNLPSKAFYCRRDGEPRKKRRFSVRITLYLGYCIFSSTEPIFLARSSLSSQQKSSLHWVSVRVS